MSYVPRILLSLFLTTALARPATAAEPTAEPAAEQPADVQPTAVELMAAMDKNLQSESQEATARMIVNDGRRVREFRMHSVSRGTTDSAVTYLEPEREKGTKMLKVEGQMWLYLPKAERVQKISGHMMRQGMMGSDVSYEDMMATDDFDEMYTAEVKGSEELDGRKQWVLLATAKDASVAYPKRTIWIDAEHMIPTKQELYALSGMLLKTWTMSDIKVIDGQNVPTKMVIADMLKEGSSTTILTEALTFDVPLEDETFSRRWLERKE
ncbi:MAG: outer membrane lipoprotein-sorting protein [Myxococcota bacterium]|jgi:outer membrane lipoprotein-sorting protein